MFTRPDSTYSTDFEKIIPLVLADEANPLNRIVDFIPEGSRVLDIGAGNGLLARVLLQKRRNIILDGIELSAHAAAIARPHYRNFYQGDIRDFLHIFRQAGFDYLVLADVIEHLQNPLELLTNLSAAAPEAKIILSIPNIAFGAVRLSLLAGDFEYVDSGLLEKTHVRFFTLKTIEALAAHLHLHIHNMYLLQRDIFATGELVPKTFSNLFTLRLFYADELAWTYQFLVVLGKTPGAAERISFGIKERPPYAAYVLKRCPGISWLARLVLR